MNTAIAMPAVSCTVQHSGIGTCLVSSWTSQLGHKWPCGCSWDHRERETPDSGARMHLADVVAVQDLHQVLGADQLQYHWFERDADIYRRCSAQRGTVNSAPFNFQDGSLCQIKCGQQYEVCKRVSPYTIRRPRRPKAASP